MGENDIRTTPESAGLDELRKHNEKLLAMVNELSTRFAAINFKAYEMAKEIQTLEMRLSGTEASYRCIEWENNQLRQENRFLRKTLLEFVDPPREIQEMIAAYRREMEAREPNSGNAGK